MDKHVAFIPSGRCDVGCSLIRKRPPSGAPILATNQKAEALGEFIHHSGDHQRPLAAHALDKGLIADRLVSA